ncbi:MAG: hypothetical protein K2W99_04295 [Chthoniobacterales bacterium]|nr:hypothetical protein [Chthoniobacterales bacterium]
MKQTTSMEKLMDEWIHLIEPSRQQLLQSRELLNKLRAARNPETSPSGQEVELERLIHQLTILCQQTEAQFSLVQEATKQRDHVAYEVNLNKLITSLNGWFSFFYLGSVEKKDFLKLWVRSMGANANENDPATLDSLGVWPKNLTACKTWEYHLLLPRKISTMMEVGSSFGVNALYLARMVRMSGVESRASMTSLAKNLQKAHPFATCQPPVDFNQGSFSPRSATSLPVDGFDAIWFHRQIWRQWIRDDGPVLFSALGELAKRAHFLLFTTTENAIPRHDLLDSFYTFTLAGERAQGSEVFKFFIAQRRFVTAAERQFCCLDMRIHDSTWQGRETLSYGATILPWVQPSIALPTRRFILSSKEVLHTFLKRTPHPKMGQFQQKEIKMWHLVSELAPELPKFLGSSEDLAGHHILLGLNESGAEFPLLPLNKKKQYIIIRSALRLLAALRKRSLHLNFLRLGNFVLTEDRAIFLSAGLIGYEEIEDPLDAFLWLLRDVAAGILYWHDLPIEPFRAELVLKLPEEYRGLASLALKSQNIDAFLSHPLVYQEFLRDP